jgi:hypothetical protein
MLLMTKIGSTIPVRTRLPGYAWAMAICVTLLSAASAYFDQGHGVGELKLAAAQGIPQGKDALVRRMAPSTRCRTSPLRRRSASTSIATKG